MKSLSILIPTLPERKLLLDELFRMLYPQMTDVYRFPSNTSGKRKIFIETDHTGKHISIGKKRDLMIRKCFSDYLVFIDDDDEISPDYVEKIYDAIQQEPDVVGMRGYMTTNGKTRESWSISTCYEWAENQDGFRYVRYPNHLAPVKLAHALEAGFPDLSHGEDYEYSMRLKKFGKLKKEVFIDSELYHYKYKTVK